MARLISREEWERLHGSRRGGAAPATPNDLVARSFQIVSTREPHDVLGMRQRGLTMASVSAPQQPGWLGNPFVADDAGGSMSRQEATARFGELVRKRAEDEAWKQAFLGLRGKRVGYYKPNEEHIHLHELQRWLAENPAPATPAAPPPDPKVQIYAGIGSRSTPPEVIEIMRLLAGRMEQDGWKLRSGGAAGADAAFESGVLDPGNRTIYLPSRSFNGRTAGNSGYVDSTGLPGWLEAMETVAKYHPAPDRLSPFARKLMARNAMQVLGPSMNRPADLIVAWTPGGLVTGGTGQALRMAADLGIEVRNLGRPEWLESARRYLGLG